MQKAAAEVSEKNTSYEVFPEQKPRKACEKTLTEPEEIRVRIYFNTQEIPMNKNSQTPLNSVLPCLKPR